MFPWVSLSIDASLRLSKKLLRLKPADFRTKCGNNEMGTIISRSLSQTSRSLPLIQIRDDRRDGTYPTRSHLARQNRCHVPVGGHQYQWRPFGAAEDGTSRSDKIVLNCSGNNPDLCLISRRNANEDVSAAASPRAKSRTRK